jgi:hypothetical protein
MNKETVNNKEASLRGTASEAWRDEAIQKKQ